MGGARLSAVGIIGGTGSAAIYADASRVDAASGGEPWGPPSAPVRRIVVGGRAVFVMPRHGAPGAPQIPPHRVNYRANLWALRQLGVDRVLALNAVGGIDAAATPGRLVIPDQIIDYTWGREHSYAGEQGEPLRHVDFTAPFSPPLRAALLAAADRLGLDVLRRGTYGATQGPRLESAAEIDRLERDGCHLVGMTGMPEAGLARELGLEYAMCCVVVNHAAGRVPPHTTLHAEMAHSLAAGMADARRVIEALIAD